MIGTFIVIECLQHNGYASCVVQLSEVDHTVALRCVHDAIGVWVLLDSVRDGPVPVEPAVMAALVATVYVMQPVIHVDDVLPRELRSGVTGVHVGTVDPVPVPGAATGRHTGVDACGSPIVRVVGPGYVVTILGNFKHVGSLPAARAWLLHNPVPMIQSLGREAVYYENGVILP